MTEDDEDRKLYILMVYNYTLKVYIMLTDNEKKVLKFLMISSNHYSINDIAKNCRLAPNGAYKILKKLENTGIIYFEEIGRIKAYRINFENPLTKNYLEIALTDDRIKESKIKIRIQDFRELKSLCKAAVIFGSYITEKKNPNDIDVLFIMDADNYKEYNAKLEDIRNIIPYKIHDVIQTQKDFIKNLKKQDKIIIEAVKNGLVLWGHAFIVNSIENAKD
ncbi:MAG: winged helix-turn-helix domain-containing protein [Nanoarchaeota archaeon]|nr:winged helix-turn-helix domain-containing protein [Nanoarchaeota archaeon]